MRFLQPRLSLLHSKTPDTTNYYFWMVSRSFLGTHDGRESSALDCYFLVCPGAVVSAAHALLQREHVARRARALRAPRVLRARRRRGVVLLARQQRGRALPARAGEAGRLRVQSAESEWRERCMSSGVYIDVQFFIRRRTNRNLFCLILKQ